METAKDKKKAAKAAKNKALAAEKAEAERVE